MNRSTTGVVIQVSGTAGYSLWQVTAAKLHIFIQILKLMGNSQTFEGLENYKEVRKGATSTQNTDWLWLRHSERPYTCGNLHRTTAKDS